jgi:inner membrane protein
MPSASGARHRERSTAMSPVTHGLISWLVANVPGVDRRGRAAVTLAGLAPDLDAFGYPFEALTRGSEHPLEWFSRYHHQLCHNALATLVIAACAWWWAGRSWRVAALALVTANLHLVCDLIGARGPEGYHWPIPYLTPFSPLEFSWSGQWRLDSWQNLVITLAALIAVTALAVRRGFSPVEILSTRADARVVAAVRARLGRPPAA